MAKRRGSGEGSVSQRSDGLWMARISVEGGKRKYFYGKTRAEVTKKMQAALHDLGQGLALLDERQTTKDYLTSWYDGMKAQVRASTYRRYGDYVHHLIPGIGRYPLAKLTPQLLRTFYNKKLAQKAGEAVSAASFCFLWKISTKKKEPFPALSSPREYQMCICISKL